MMHLFKSITLLLIALFSSTVLADVLPRSNSTWQLLEQAPAQTQTENVLVEGSVIVAKVELMRMYGVSNPNILTDKLSQAISISANNLECEVKDVSWLNTKLNKLRVNLIYSCPMEASELSFNFQKWFELSPNHIHFFRLNRANVAAASGTIQRARPSMTVELNSRVNAESKPSEAWPVFTQYLTTGIYHILTGWDHLALVAGVLLSAVGLRQVLIMISGFTLGHSLSLILASIGVLSADSAKIEALIGFSIIVIAMEAFMLKKAVKFQGAFWMLTLLFLALFWAGPADSSIFTLQGVMGVGLFSLGYLYLIGHLTKAYNLRLIITTLFGIVHGFGFAGLLSEIGLPEQQQVISLFAFNLGVELGQVAVVLLVLFLSYQFKEKFKRLQQIMPLLGSYCLITLGTFWFVSRAIS